VPGTDSELRREYVVVGAHYDHIGASGRYALDPGPAVSMMHLGADDNASGTVAVLELARRLSIHPTRRSVVFVNFGAEELGLIGSQVFVDNSPIPIEDVITMINLDMVGRLRGNFLILYTGGADDRFHQIVDSVERIPPVLDFRVSWRPAAIERSDLIPFARAHVPVLSPFTDFHVDYHRVGDIVSRINFAGLEKVVDLTERVIRGVADGNTRPGNTARSR
jgi:Zn-dependent M28 family amino/carboxypeptidase